MILPAGRRWRRAVLVAALAWFPATASVAIDNPDAPDLAADFRTRAEAFETRIGASAGSLREIEAAYADYERFLDGELNHAYRALAKKLGAAAQTILAQSQQRWLVYRDAEFRFIENNWTFDRFGTSAALSRGAYRSSIIKDRTITLLEYLKNYPKG